MPAYIENRAGQASTARTFVSYDRLRDIDVFVKTAVGPERYQALCNEWLLLHDLAPGYFAQPVEFRALGPERAYMTTEVITGDSLLDSKLVADEHMFFVMVQEALRGLAILHRAGYVHGDIRPQNLVVGRRGRKILAVWTDLEHAIQVDSAEARSTYVPGFHDPGLEHGVKQTPKTDLYALGQSLLERIPVEEDIKTVWGECLLNLAESVCDPNPLDDLADAERALYYLDAIAVELGAETMAPRPWTAPPWQIRRRLSERELALRWRRWGRSGGARVAVTSSPGSGKSTFLRRATARLALEGHPVLDLLPDGPGRGSNRDGLPDWSELGGGKGPQPVVLLDASTWRTLPPRRRSAAGHSSILLIEANTAEQVPDVDDVWELPPLTPSEYLKWVHAST